MPTNPLQAIIDQFTLIYPSISAWTGTVTVRRDKDLAAIKDQLPPRTLVSDGVIHLVPKKFLARPVSYRKEVVRRILEGGFAFMGGYGVKTANVDAKLAEIAKIEAEYWTSVSTIKRDLALAYEEQKQAFPAWAHLIDEHCLTETEVGTRYAFRVAPLTIQPPSSKAAVAAYDQSIATVTDAILDSIASTAKDIQYRLFVAARSAPVTARTIKCVWELVAKLDSFSFVETRWAPIVSHLRNVLATFPAKDEFSPNDKLVLNDVLLHLADPVKVLAATSIAVQTGTNAVQLAMPSTTLAASVEDVATDEAGPDNDTDTVSVPMPPPTPTTAIPHFPLW